MNSYNLTNINHEDFNSFYELMSEAFPPIERRKLENQKKLLENDFYNIVGYKENDRVIAFIASWEFENFNFIEHFAVDNSYRGNGIGSKILKQYLNKYKNKPVFLEVEYPEDNYSKRRIEFYKRLGFSLNDYEYVQPPLEKGNELLPLKIMSYPKESNNKQLNRFRNNVYKHVYKCIEDN